MHQTVNENKAIVGCTDTSPNVASAGFTLRRMRLQRCAIQLFLDQWVRHEARVVRGVRRRGQTKEAVGRGRQRLDRSGGLRRTEMEAAASYDIIIMWCPYNLRVKEDIEMRYILSKDGLNECVKR